MPTKFWSVNLDKGISSDLQALDRKTTLELALSNQ